MHVHADDNQRYSERIAFKGAWHEGDGTFDGIDAPHDGQDHQGHPDTRGHQGNPLGPDFLHSRDD